MTEQSKGKENNQLHFLSQRLSTEKKIFVFVPIMFEKGFKTFSLRLEETIRSSSLLTASLTRWSGWNSMPPSERKTISESLLESEWKKNRPSSGKTETKSNLQDKIFFSH
jgi:hypothetical protein